MAALFVLDRKTYLNYLSVKIQGKCRLLRDMSCGVKVLKRNSACCTNI